MTKKDSGKRSFEQSLSKLEKIVSTLEQGDVPLEESIALYEEGITLSKECMETLSKAEVKIKQLTKTINGTFELTDYNK